jgi:LDH2 family malate/lactate/ureidoglycolate dehydrogenase
MKISFQELLVTLKTVLIREGFPEEKAAVYANIFAINRAKERGIHQR